MGSGGGSSGSTYTVPITWQQILPPWTQEGQQWLLPLLKQRVLEGGMTNAEMEFMKGMAAKEVNASTIAARKALGQRMASSGMSTRSPAYAEGMANIESGRIGSTADLMANLVKLKLGARDTATAQLQTALYTPPPYATSTFGSQSSKGAK